MDTAGSQLQFFEASTEGAIRRPMVPPSRLELRQDHVILLGILGLIGVSIIFACGVERGKRLARAERVLIAPSSTSTAKSPPAVPSSAPSTSERRSAPSEKPASAPRGPKRLVSGNGRFAVQVVSYSKPELAARELKRLQAKGESAFLVKKQNTTVLYVGPFDSQKGAKNKLAGLRSRYQDCFVRSL
jgi:cell division septation protein DedD